MFAHSRILPVLVTPKQEEPKRPAASLGLSLLRLVGLSLLLADDYFHHCGLHLRDGLCEKTRAKLLSHRQFVQQSGDAVRL